jgi:glycosyltransferase involved in cell wall biosynthesis
MVTIVLPTRNEATIIGDNLRRLLAFLTANLHADWRVIIADNASTDATRAIVRDIAVRESHLELFELPEAGKGRAVLAAWTRAASHPPAPPLPKGGEESTDFSPSPKDGEREGVDDVFVFMDADLATDLRHVPELIAGIRAGADIAIGSRYARGAQTERSAFRHFVSLANRTLLRMNFGLRVTDPPCGCKAVNERVVRTIVPHIRDTQWFFDTELLIRAHAAGMRIVEIPVSWREPRRGGSIRKVARITIANLRAIQRLRRELRAR